MEEQFISHLVSNIGVPAALCFYSLFCVNARIEKLSDKLDNLTQSLHERIAKIERDVSDLQRKVT